jgi:hypothetical protein
MVLQHFSVFVSEKAEIALQKLVNKWNILACKLFFKYFSYPDIPNRI